MASLTNPQLQYLRDAHPHVKKTYVSAVPKIALLSARVNSPGISLGAESIPYDTGTESAAKYALIEAGQTFILGSTPGAEDLGRGRVKAISGNQTAGTLTVAWNSDINWADNAYLTVLHLYELWPKFPRFTVSPEVFYKDKTITYTDENTNRSPVIRMGCGWAGRLSSGSVVATLNATESYAMTTGGSISSYSWQVFTAVIGASPVIASAAASSTTITFDLAGLYWVKCTITANNGKTQSSYRPFIVHDAIGGNDQPYPIEEATRSEDYESQGVSFTFTVQGDADETEFPKRTPIIVWSENIYNGTVVDVSFVSTGAYAGRTHIDFFGYITEHTLLMGEGQTGNVAFSANTIEVILANKFEYSVSLIADPAVRGGTVSAWWHFPASDLGVAQAIHHLWKHHSTLLDVADIILPTSDARRRAGLEEFTESSLLERATDFARNKGIFANPCCDIYGTIHVSIDIQFLNDADRAAQIDTFTMSTKDWKGDMEIRPKQLKEVSMVYVSGGNWNGSAYSAFCSQWADIASNDGYNIAIIEQCMFASQSEANIATGRVAAVQNNSIEEISFNMAGNWSSAIGIMPQQWIRFSLTGTEPGNKNGLVLNNIRAIPRTIETTFNSNSGGVSETTIIVQPEAFGRNGVSSNCFGAPTDRATPGTPVWDDSEAGATTTFLATGFSNDSNGRSVAFAGTLNPLALGSTVEIDTSDVEVTHLISLSTTTAIIVYTDQSTGNIEGKIATITGTTVNLGPSNLLINSAFPYRVVALTSTKAMLLFADSVVILTISGTSITAGTPLVVVDPIGTSLVFTAIEKLTESLVMFIGGNNTHVTVRGCPLTVSGTTITQQTFDDASPENAIQNNMVALSSTACIVVYRLDDGSNDLRAVLLYNISSSGYTQGAVITVDGTNGCDGELAISRLDSTHAIVGYRSAIDATQVWAAVITYDGSTTITAGTPVKISDGTNSRFYVDLAAVSPTSVAVVISHADEAGTFTLGTARSLSIAGTVITDNGDAVTVIPQVDPGATVVHVTALKDV